MAFVFAVAQLRCQPEQKTREMLANLAPWMDAEHRDKVMDRARKYARAGRGLGKLIGLTEAERQECEVWWLASIDGDMARAMSRRVDGRQSRKERRQKEGAMTRDEYLASYAGSEQKAKPWEALGISRSTYYRNKLHGLPKDVTLGSPTTYKGECKSVGAPSVNAHPAAADVPHGGDHHANGAVAIRRVATMDRPPRPSRRPRPLVSNTSAKLPWWPPRRPEVTLYDSVAPDVAA
jgi:hypothetical protein